MDQARAPQFLLIPSSRLPLWRDVLYIVCAPGPAVFPLGLYHSRRYHKGRVRGPAFFASALLHLAVVFFCYRVPFALFFQNVLATGQTAHRVYDVHLVYNLKTLKVSDYFPALQPAGPGGMPGHGTVSTPPPTRGSDAFDDRVTIISAPPIPDNYKQRIEQPALPPELKIPVDVPLPNVILGVVLPRPEPPSQHLNQPWHPVIPRIENQTAISARVAVPELPRLTLPSESSRFQVSRLQVPDPPHPALAESSNPSEAQAAEGYGEPQVAAAPTGADLLSLSVEPAPVPDSVTILPGERQGEFTISPVGGLQGSPGGIPNENSQGGNRRSGSGGDGSTGLGPGTRGGGGGDAAPAAAETISVTNSADGAGKAGGESLPSFFAATLVFRVLSPIRPRLPGLIVASGPRGGGGLPVYGVLRGRKVYSIYLPMPGRNWILEYCDPRQSSQPGNYPTRTVEVQLTTGLVPPSVEERFDFHRPPFPRHREREMIILHGVITEDGSVTELNVIQSLQKVADQAALIAFSRWKFKPALQGDKAVAVEILVGIPSIGEEPQELSAAN